MEIINPNQTQGKLSFTSSDLVLLAFATAFFPRVLMMLKVPSFVNFLHFATVPLVCLIILTKVRTKDKQQIAVSKNILIGLSILLTIGFASALLNGAGIINVILHFILLAEPFILILAIISIPMSPKRVERFRAWVLGFGFANLLFALTQKFVLKWDTCGCSPGGWAEGDAIKGVFINQGSGHVVGASVSVSLSTYYFVTATNRPIWLRSLVVFASLLHLVAADAKQVIVTLVAGFAILSLSKMQDISKLIIYVTGTLIFCLAFAWGMQNIEALSAFNGWVRPEIYGPDGDATKLKFVSIRIITEHFHSPLNWLLGLGPGHTVDRLGGWMLRDYSDLLSPLGATQSDTSLAVWRATAASWLGDQSSMFSPFWGWVAIWGDIGFLGLATFLYLCSVAWRFCDDLPKFLMLSVLIHGFIFTQMQEPGYMLFIACLVGLRWQELRRDKQIRVEKNFGNFAAKTALLE
jgi:hypothetical protein